MPQVVPPRVSDPRFDHRGFKPVPPVFKRFTRSGWLKHTPTTYRPGRAQPIGRPPQHHLMGRESVLRPRDVQHRTLLVYHVPRQSVLTALPKSSIDRQIELRRMQGPLGFNDLPETVLLQHRQKPDPIVVFAGVGDGARRIEYWSIANWKLVPQSKSTYPE